MKLGDILVEATADDSDFARRAYSGELANKQISSDVKFEKFLGKDKYDEFVAYRGILDLGSLSVQTGSQLAHPESRTNPAEYRGIDDDFDVVYSGQFYYAYDSEENEPHFWRFIGALEMDYGSKKLSNMEFEGVGSTWKDSLNELTTSMESFAEEKAQDIYDGY